MIIGVDVDGVLRNLIDSLNVYWEKKNEEALRFETVDGWNIERYYQGGKDVRKFLFDSTWTEAIYKEALPYSDNCDDLDKIPEEHRVHIITANWGKLFEYTKEWLDNHSIGYDLLISSNSKTECEFDILIDDKPTTIEDCWRVGKCGILMDRPWNKQYRLPRINRINELEQIWRPYGS